MTCYHRVNLVAFVLT